MQEGAPQQVYDDPANLFVAKFLGTPPINVFEAKVSGGVLLIGDMPAMDAPGVPDMKVWAGVRPEGLVPEQESRLEFALDRVEVLGRDVSVVCSHPDCRSGSIRAVIDPAHRVDGSKSCVRFALRPDKVFLFDMESQRRVPVEARGK